MQGESPDVVLQRIVESKGEMRKNMLNGYMKALDESEGLQQTIARLADRMGVGEHLRRLAISRPPITQHQGMSCHILPCHWSTCDGDCHTGAPDLAWPQCLRALASHSLQQRRNAGPAGNVSTM